MNEYRRIGKIQASPYKPGDDLSGVPFSEDTQPGVGDWLWRWDSDPEGMTRVMTGKWMHDHYEPVGVKDGVE